MTVKEARQVCVNATQVQLSSITSNDVIKFEQAFAVSIDLELTVRSMLSGTGRLSEVDAANVIKSTDIVKTILALKNNKSVPKEQTLVTVLARIALGQLQNVGDQYQIDYEKFVIKFNVVEALKYGYDWPAIAQDAGLCDETKMEEYKKQMITNQSLLDVYKLPTCAGNPSGASQAIADGRLDSTRRTTDKSVDVVVSVAYKEEKKEDK